MKHRGIHASLFICVLIPLAFGCGKNDESSPSATATTSATNPSAATAPAAPPPSEADIMISNRSLDYVEGLIERKEFQKAREALALAETRSLTAAQRQRANSLKAKIPAN
jgi:hypothetical protein